MASQTGTLKFRQSDGTYTELYPKTTIAQVDGLQTQLDSINTSLQNKVDYQSTKDLSITKLYPQIRFYSEDVPNVFAELVLDSQHGTTGTFSIMLINKSTDTTEMAFYLGNEDKSLYLTVDKINYKIATEQYVSNSIQGAISASY